MTPHDYCRDKVAAKRSALRYSLMFLDKPRREAITAVYAFRQEVGGIVRECTSIEPARAKLAWWRAEIADLFSRRAHHPVTQALADALKRFPISRELLLEVVDGYEMDLEQSCYEDFPALERYCHRVSSSVSLIVSATLGFQNPQTEEFAKQLGLAQQAINIIRDVGLDARLGRVYLPLDELQRFNVGLNDIYDSRHSDKVMALLVFQAERARKLYAEALSRLPREDRKAQCPALALAAIQGKILDEIQRDNFRVLDRRLFLPPLRKLWVVAKTRIAN